MNRALLSGLSTLLFPFAAHAAATSAGGYLMRGGYQPRSHARLQIDALSPAVTAPQKAKPSARHAAAPTDVATLDILQQPVATELVVIDGSVADKATLYRGLKPGVVAVEIDPALPGLPQLADALRGHRNLAAIHVVSHASAGVLLLGNSRITPENAHEELAALSALREAVRPGADLLFYGCDLAASSEGSALLDIVRQQTGLDVAASSNPTGSLALGGDWDLEVVRGSIETTVAFSDKALKDFSHVLVASSGTKTFSSGWTDNNTSLNSTDFIVTGKDSGGSLITNISIYVGPPNPAYLQTGYNATTTGTYFQVAADGVNTGAFELTGLVAGEYGTGPTAGQFTNVHIVGIKPDNTTVTSTSINGTATPQETFSFGAGQLANFAGVKLKAFKLVFDTSGASTTKPYFEFRNFTIQGAIGPVPFVSDGRISISGGSGTGGAYKIGDTVTATWNNTAGGDNNSGITGVTVDFSQFGGGSAVPASNSGNTWTATYTITAGSIDATNRNVSVTATNAGGSTTTADTTNATVDSVALTVTDGSINISGASGIGGAYRIGDTVTATWDNTAGGDNNTDIINSVTVNFAQFGGGAAVPATNSSGTWTATYTIVAGGIAANNRNVVVTAQDNAGNATTTGDTTNAAVDNIAPFVSSIAVNGSPGSGATSMAFTVSFSESVANVSTDDFTLVGTGSASGSIASVSASTGSTVNVNIAGISGTGTLKVNLNGGTNIIDGVGNSIPAYNGGSTHTVNVLTAPGAPTIGTATPGDAQASVTFSAPASNGGSAITTYTATANPGGATGTCAGPAACTATVTGLNNGTAYTFTVTATNGVGTSTASGASNSVTPKGNQTITFANPGPQSFGTSPTLTATASSSLAPTFTSSTTGVCTITGGGTLTFVTAGSCTISADQAGNGTWNAATTVPRTFTVNAIVPGAPTIGTATAGDTQASVTFSAPASNGGAAITGYTVTSSPTGITGTGAGSPITVTSLTNGVAYTFTVTATNSAGAGPASAASNSVTPASPQTITFANPGTQTYGTSPNLSTLGGGASSTSGLPVTFTSSTTGVCTITSAGVLTFVTAGTCTINANQAGNSSFLAATQVSRSFTVSPVVPAAPTSVVATAGDTQVSVAFVAPTNTGGTAITGYTVTANPPDVAPVGGASSPIVVTGLTNGQAYTFTVTADNAAGTGAASAASNSVTPKAVQTITFTNPGTQNFGTTPTLTATSDSGLSPTFTSGSPGSCSITPGGALTFLTAGNCTINADQAGNGSYLAAAQVTRTFSVNAQLVVSGAVPGMAGLATATLSGGGAACTLNSGGTAFITPGSTPGGYTLPHGGFQFLATGCTSNVTLTLNYPDPLPAGVQFWKLGPATPGALTSTWFAWTGATLSPDRRTVVYTVTDNGVGDSDSALGTIRDPFAPALAAPGSGAVGIPVDNPWALALMASIVGWLGVRYRQRRAG
ncbi:DUF4347 domain-containing protein [Acidovorax sp. Leaf78]|uniref:DUF4347 domain-containing protein n=1 Tax=Acidovorax sp. Leaf78 TaxID=1736237 RepID=UPI0006F42775|nr:DUF4347 domain-containing protein [Acidovorax sp. Leaf78]KQO16913.1 hypothetical protein ASF16_13560 [Acidovorax sp. Leaf78]